MLPRVSLFPSVTTSRTQFIRHIANICEVGNVEDYKKEEWIKRIELKLCEACYFVGMMFVEKVSFYLILHELIHHISAFIRGLTQSKIWYKIDYILDGLDIFIFRKN